MFSRIRALAIYVTDIKRAKTFYTTVLNFEALTDIEPNIVFLKSKDITLYLEGGKTPAATDSESSRLSFFLQAEASAFKTYTALKKRGVVLLQKAPEQLGENTYWFQMKDPDGNIIEVTGTGDGV
jgi:predicted enzyme related to lactoylglutathione lyase